MDDANLKVSISVRIPLLLRARLIKAAYGQGRTINAEIVRRLVDSFPVELEPHEREPTTLVEPEQSNGP